ncbi:MAG: hypothetical protein JWN71_2879 [Xanthobacteraceae bacterium]|nr:hypothetical protein [Xanthobacteraceae bacterium]
MDWVAIGTFVAGLLAGYTIRVAIEIRTSKKSINSTVRATHGSVVQSGNTAGGHIAGGNIKTDSK